MQFVVLHHTGVAEPHFDFMFERQPGESLRTFRIPEWPMQTGSEQSATELPDHRRDYLTYEGPVSGNRGKVKRVAAGAATTSEENGRVLCEVTLETQGNELLGFQLHRQSGTAWTIRRVR